MASFLLCPANVDPRFGMDKSDSSSDWWRASYGFFPDVLDRTEGAVTSGLTSAGVWRVSGLTAAEGQTAVASDLVRFGQLVLQNVHKERSVNVLYIDGGVQAQLNNADWWSPLSSAVSYPGSTGFSWGQHIRIRRQLTQTR